jgi:hypothetical protein
MELATAEALANGWLLPDDAADLMRRARQSPMSQL